MSKKADEIARFIGYGYMTVKIDGGYLWIVRGIPFTRRMADENDPMVKRIIINIMAEFLTAY